MKGDGGLKSRSWRSSTMNGCSLYGAAIEPFSPTQMMPLSVGYSPLRTRLFGGVMWPSYQKTFSAGRRPSAGKWYLMIDQRGKLTSVPPSLNASTLAGLTRLRAQYDVFMM